MSIGRNSKMCEGRKENQNLFLAGSWVQRRTVKEIQRPAPGPAGLGWKVSLLEFREGLQSCLGQSKFDICGDE